jgi:hypothetical protein
MTLVVYIIKAKGLLLKNFQVLILAVHGFLDYSYYFSG